MRYLLLRHFIFLTFVLMVFSCKKNKTPDPDPSEIDRSDLYYKARYNGLPVQWTLPFDYTTSLEYGVGSSIYSSTSNGRATLGVSALMGSKILPSNLIFIWLNDTATITAYPRPSFFLPRVKVGSYSFSQMNGAMPSPGVNLEVYRSGREYTTLSLPQKSGYFKITKIQPLPTDTLHQLIMEAEFAATVFYINDATDTFRIEATFRGVIVPRD